MNTAEQKNNAIDALIRNIADDGVFNDDFMTLLDIRQPEAQELMIEDHPAQWVALLIFRRGGTE